MLVNVKLLGTIKKRVLAENTSRFCEPLSVRHTAGKEIPCRGATAIVFCISNILLNNWVENDKEGYHTDDHILNKQTKQNEICPLY